MTEEDSFEAGARFQDVVESALTGKCIFLDEPSNVECYYGCFQED